MTIESPVARLTVSTNTAAPRIRSAFLGGDAFTEFHVAFDEPILFLGNGEDLWNWRIFSASGDLPILSVRLVAQNELAFETASPTSDSYSYETTGDIFHRCTGGFLPAGATGTFNLREQTILDFNTPEYWKYLDTGVDPGPNWMNLDFDDGAWRSGLPLFDGYFDVGRPVVETWNVNTVLRLTNSINASAIPTYLFRQRFFNFHFFGNLRVNVIHDDGFILYFNGHEVYRRGIVNGTEPFGMFGAISQTPGSTDEVDFVIDATNIVFGDNVIATLVKQASPQSKDVTFGMRIKAVDLGHGDPFPIVCKQPKSIIVSEGHAWKMDVAICGSGLTYQYQWFRNGVLLPGKTNPSIEGVADLKDAGTYTVFADGPFGTVLSTPAVLDVQSVITPYTASWKYQTNQQDATLGGTQWYSVAFDDAGWLVGRGPFGYETTASTLARLPAPISTPLTPASSGQNPSTAYFRSRVSVPSIAVSQSLVLCHTIDDGAAVYVDGQLTYRYNLNAQAPIYSTNTAGPTPGDGDARTVCVPFPLEAGEHLIAVEVHQDGSANQDVVFGLELRAVSSPALSIRPGLNRSVILEWVPDRLWDLVTGPSVAGPYVATPGSSNGVYAISNPAESRYYRLEFNDR